MGNLWSNGNENKKKPNYNSPIVNGKLNMAKLENMYRNMTNQSNSVNNFIKTFLENHGEPVEIHSLELATQNCRQLEANLRRLHEVLEFIGELHTKEIYMSEETLNDILSQGEFQIGDEAVKAFCNTSIPKEPTSIIELANWGEDPLLAEIKDLTNELLCYAKAGTDDGTWTIFCDNGELKLYSRIDNDTSGYMCDPLKATNCIQGVTAKELIDIFYNTEHIMYWDNTIDRMNVIEKAYNGNPDIMILHLIHKRIALAARRESVFWSHRFEISDQKDADAHDAYAVCNVTTEFKDVKLDNPQNVRAGAKVIMLCQTIINNKSKKVSRNDVRCRIIYMAQINPGGIVPLSAMQHVYKREFPKVLRRIGEYAQEKFQDLPLNL